MLVNFAMNRYAIGAGLTLSGKLKQQRHLQVARGRVWVTVEGQGDDFWLSAGQSMALPAHRLLVLQAENEESEVELCLQPCLQACPQVDAKAGPYGNAAAANMPANMHALAA